ncbi:MAG TPA: hypothetical protein VF266_15525 [Thermoanaerobaculia bacterium]
MSARTGSDSGKWIIGALVAAIVASQGFLMLQNKKLRDRVSAQDSVKAQVNLLRTKADRTIYSASMFGRCRPLAGETLQQPRALDVAIYFSIDHDCISCITDLVNQWNGALKSEHGAALRVHGYTQIDGAVSRQNVADLKAAFPITHVGELKTTLANAGVTVSPVVFVSDAATGRILLTDAPLASEKSDGSFVKRVQALLTPCG